MNHPYLTDGGKFESIGTIIDQGKSIYGYHGDARKIESVYKNIKRTVYNITVENDHTYIAGGFRVHNKLHHGGHISENRVPGKTGADVQEVLQEGEYVIRKEVVDKLGPDFFDAINKAFAPK